MGSKRWKAKNLFGFTPIKIDFKISDRRVFSTTKSNERDAIKDFLNFYIKSYQENLEDLLLPKKMRKNENKKD